MARTIDVIKEEITTSFMSSEAAASLYGFTVGDNFAAHFSKVSVESVLFYVVASSIWVLEKMMDSHRADVDERIAVALPHRPVWYRNKALAFMQGCTLSGDTDSYDTTGMTDEEISAALPVKWAAAVESADASILTIKVAGEEGGVRCRLDEATAAQLLAYLGEIKDAGVRISLVNKDPDTYNCEVDVYYDPMLAPSTVEAACRAAIRTYITNLPFNGEYTNMSLVDALQLVEGVKVVEFGGATTTPSGVSGVSIPINGRYTPISGYFMTAQVTINMVAYE